MRKTWMLGAIAVASVFAFNANAAERNENKRGDVNVILQGGIGDYSGSLGNFTQTGPSWGVTLNLQPTHVLGYEIGYDGSRNLVDDERLVDSTALTRHGGYGLLKLGLPFIEKVRPFAGVGLGASYIHVSDGGHDGLYQNDFVEEVPLAAGVEFNTGLLTAGARLSFHWLIDESFADPGTQGNPQGGYVNGALNLGARF